MRGGVVGRSVCPRQRLPSAPKPQAGVTGTHMSTVFCVSVRPAPSTVTVQPSRGSVSGFCRDTSATSLRFFLGSPRIWGRTQGRREGSIEGGAQTSPGQAGSRLGYPCICCNLAQCLLNRAMPILPLSLLTSVPQFPHLEWRGSTLPCSRA